MNLALESGYKRLLRRRQRDVTVQGQQDAVAHDNQPYVLQHDDDALVAHEDGPTGGVGAVEDAQVAHRQPQPFALAQRSLVGRMVCPLPPGVYLEPCDAPAQEGAGSVSEGRACNPPTASLELHS